MTTSSLNWALKNYEEQLTTLATKVHSSTDAQFLSILVARDAVEAALTAESVKSTANLLKVIHLDECLKQQAKAIPKTVKKLVEWRKSRKPKADAWWWFFEAHPLSCALKDYEDKLRDFQDDDNSSDSLGERYLAVLVARDAVEAALTKPAIKSAKNQSAIIRTDEHLDEQIEAVIQATENWDTLNKLDDQLKQQVSQISRRQRKKLLERLTKWRKSRQPPAEAWWWFSGSYRRCFFGFYAWLRQFTWLDNLDWLWSAVSFLCLTISIALIVDISSRFFTGRPELGGAIQVSLQSLFTLLAGGSALTKPGRKFTQEILTYFNIPKRLWHEFSVLFSCIVLLVLFLYHHQLPQIADRYVERGKENYRAGQLSSAKQNFERALSLNPDEVGANYLLGNLYEKLNKFDDAITQYQIAAQGNFVLAYNDLARLYILKNKPELAISLLLRSIELVEEPTNETNYSLEKLGISSEKVRYLSLNNLGWARLNQKRYEEAESRLIDAIKISPRKAPAYCLLAQALEGMGNEAKAKDEWLDCLTFAKAENPDEDLWMGLAIEATKSSKQLRSNKQK